MMKVTLKVTTLFFLLEFYLIVTRDGSADVDALNVLLLVC